MLLVFLRAWCLIASFAGQIHIDELPGETASRDTELELHPLHFDDEDVAGIAILDIHLEIRCLSSSLKDFQRFF